VQQSYELYTPIAPKPPRYAVPRISLHSVDLTATRDHHLRTGESTYSSTNSIFINLSYHTAVLLIPVPMTRKAVPRLLPVQPYLLVPGGRITYPSAFDGVETFNPHCRYALPFLIMIHSTAHVDYPFCSTWFP